MAQMPMDPNAGAMDEQDPMAGEEQGGYTICLTVSPDGAMSVSVEDAAQESAEAEGGESEPTGTPVKGLKDAIEKIMTIVQNGGKMDDAEGEQDFAAGFNGDKATPTGKRFA